MRKKPANEKLLKVSSEWQRIIQAFNNPVLILIGNFNVWARYTEGSTI
ncbi:MAG: hypothetical protein KJ649_07860 [Proteobacteria bacterium]|nr:hypothetical protein [Pseudomonadota bacterium]